MLKIKKIMESVIPKSYQISDGEKTAVRLKFDDGLMYYQSSYRADRIYCMRCGSLDNISERGQIACQKCGNTRVREMNASGHTTYVRNCELIDEFIVVKNSVIRYREKMTGPDVYSYDESCIVIQGNEAAFFENKLIGGYDDGGIRKWTRVKKPTQYRLPQEDEYVVRVHDEALYDNSLFQFIYQGLYEKSLSSIFCSMMQSANGVDATEVDCPEFNDSVVIYDEAKALAVDNLEVRKEPTGNGNMIRVHTWCTKCKRYGQKIISGQYSYGTECCTVCHEYSGHMSRISELMNYYVFPQEFDDGKLLLRVDEVLCKAKFNSPNTLGINPTIAYELELQRTFYVYVLLNGKALFFNERMEPVDKTGIIVRKGRGVGNHNYILSDEHMNVIKNNKAMKRTGFIEYTDNMNGIDLRYFDALVKIPSLEMLSKLGMSSLVHDIIYADDKDLPGYMKKDDKKNGIKRLSKPQMQGLIASNCSLSKFIFYMQIVKKDEDALYEDFDWITSHSHARHILDILRVKIPGMTVKKMREYLERVDEAQCCPVNESAQLWSDYVRMLRDLDCDLTDKGLIYPNSLKREHDKAARKLTQVKDEKLNAVFRERAEKNDKYAWENKEFKVLIPHDISELYEEGRKLSHCVGTYGKMVAEGHSTIAFIRKITDLDTPLCTIEIRQDAIVQARGLSNRPAENIPKMKGFITDWAKNKGLYYAA